MSSKEEEDEDEQDIDGLDIYVTGLDKPKLDNVAIVISLSSR